MSALKLFHGAVLSGLLAFPVSAETADASRIALVVGSSRYAEGEVSARTSAADATAVAAELRRKGFRVEEAEDATRADLAARAQRLIDETRPGSTVVVYLAGLAIQSGRRNYFLPTDARIATEADVQAAGLNVSQLVETLASREAAQVFVVVDAAHGNAFERRFRAHPIGLAPIATLPKAAFVAYSTAPGSVLAAPAGARSLFSNELVKQIDSADGVSAAALEQTGAAVSNLSGQEQMPWWRSGLSDPSGSGEARPPADSAPAAPGGPAPAGGPARPRIAALAYSPSDTALVGRLSAVLARNPGDTVSRYTRGQVYALHYDFGKALADFDEVIRASPNDVEALNNRCWVRAIVDTPDSALADCNAALGLRPDFVDALDSRGFIMLKAERALAAASDYDQVLGLNAQQASALYGRGLARLRLGATAAGQGDMKLALSLDPRIGDQFALFGVR